MKKLINDAEKKLITELKDQIERSQNRIDEIKERMNKLIIEKVKGQWGTVHWEIHLNGYPIKNNYGYKAEFDSCEDAKKYLDEILKSKTKIETQKTKSRKRG